MASSRFGGVSPTHSYQARVKWLVAGLISVIVVLAIAVIYIAQSSSASSDGGPVATAPTAPEGNTGAVQILVTSRRVENGEQLVDAMVLPKGWDSSELPEGVLLATELESIRGMYFKNQLGARVPLLRSHITQIRPITPIDIPPGFRAVTINVDKRSGVEGFAKPNSRVDILWTFIGPDRKKKVKTIVRFVKVLAVGGQLRTEGAAAAIGNATTVTILVSERDAKKIELARTLGTLSLSLVGSDEAPKTSSEELDEDIDINDLMGGPQQTNQPSPADGVMYTEDPKTGKMVRYELRGGRWKRAADN